MNKLDRQLAIALLLQNRKTINAQKIAEYFGISVRTVYRDIQVLCDAGLPVAALPGEGYAIMDGYRLPALMFDRPELTALHLGLELAQRHGDRAIHEGSARARVKLENSLPPLVRLQYDGIVDDLLVHSVPPSKELFEKSWITLLEESIRTRRVARAQRKAGGSLDLHPLILYFHEGQWLVIAADPKGNQFDLALADLKSLDLTDRTFEPPADFTFSRYWTSRAAVTG